MTMKFIWKRNFSRKEGKLQENAFLHRTYYWS